MRGSDRIAGERRELLPDDVGRRRTDRVPERAELGVDGLQREAERALREPDEAGQRIVVQARNERPAARPAAMRRAGVEGSGFGRTVRRPSIGA